MGLEADVTKAELQVIAFGRPVRSDADRAEAMARLVALEAPEVVEQPVEPPDPELRESAVGEPEVREPSPRRRFALFALAVVVAVAVVAAVGIYRKQQDPFAAFDRPPTSADLEYSSQYLGDVDPQNVRLLGEDSVYRVWGYWGPPVGSPADNAPGIVEVCLVVTGGTRHDGTCATESTLTTEGIHTSPLELSVDSDGARHVVKYTWGPSGPLSPRFTTVPPPATLDDVFDRKPTNEDLQGREFLLSESTTVSDSARWVADYHDVRIWIYRDAPNAICMMATDTKSGIGRVNATCAPEPTFRASGMVLDWPVESVQLELSPALSVSVSVVR